MAKLSAFHSQYFTFVRIEEYVLVTITVLVIKIKKNFTFKQVNAWQFSIKNTHGRAAYSGAPHTVAQEQNGFLHIITYVSIHTYIHTYIHTVPTFIYIPITYMHCIRENAAAFS